MMSPLPITAMLFRGGLASMRARMAITEFRQCLATHELQAPFGVVAMDFLHSELAHEVDGFLGNDLPRHHDREARRIRDHETGGDEVGTGLQATVDLGIGETEVFATHRVIRRIEAAA